MKTLVPASEAMKNTFPALELMDSYEVPSITAVCSQSPYPPLPHCHALSVTHFQKPVRVANVFEIESWGILLFSAD